MKTAIIHYRLYADELFQRVREKRPLLDSHKVVRAWIYHDGQHHRKDDLPKHEFNTFRAAREWALSHGYSKVKGLFV